MAGDDKVVKGLTRALLLGVTFGAGPLIQVGCAPVPSDDGVRAAAAPGGVAAEPNAVAAGRSEQELCAMALETRAARDVNALLRAYPDGDCVAPTLGAMPPGTLRAVSPSALQNLSPAVRSQVPANARRHLPNLAAGGDTGTVY